MVKLSPSILAADFTRLGESCASVLNAGADMLHIDVMDGAFVPNISLGVPVLAALSARLPAFYDVHLMIQRPLQYVTPFCEAGATLLTFHLEAEGDPAQTIRAIRAAGCRVGLSIKPATPSEALFPYLNDLDLALVMSVEPGFGGQKFMPQAVEKIAALRAEADRRGLALDIEVDGGINEATAPLCWRAGANVLVAGSAVFRAPDPAGAIAALRRACGPVPPRSISS